MVSIHGPLGYEPNTLTTAPLRLCYCHRFNFKSSVRLHCAVLRAITHVGFASTCNCLGVRKICQCEANRFFSSPSIRPVTARMLCEATDKQSPSWKANLAAKYAGGFECGLLHRLGLLLAATLPIHHPPHNPSFDFLLPILTGDVVSRFTLSLGKQCMTSPCRQTCVAHEVMTLYTKEC